MDRDSPRFLQGVFNFVGAGYGQAAAAERQARLHGARRQARAADLLPRRQFGRMSINLVLMRDGKPMRYFPIGAKGAMHVPLAVVEDLLPGDQARVFWSRRRRESRARRARHRLAWKSDARPYPERHDVQERAMNKQRLVVIGNGMAGARAVEEILARGGAEHVRHRHVRRRALRQLQPHPALERAERRPGRRARSSSTRSTGTRRTASRCIAGAVRHRRSTARAQGRAAGDGPSSATTSCLIATGSRAFIPPMPRCMRAQTAQLKQGVFGFRTLDDCGGIVDAAKHSKKGGRDRRRPAGAGGGARPAQLSAARCTSSISPAT